MQEISHISISQNFLSLKFGSVDGGGGIIRHVIVIFGTCFKHEFLFNKIRLIHDIRWSHYIGVQC
jgi:hypothetical protein